MRCRRLKLLKRCLAVNWDMSSCTGRALEVAAQDWCSLAKRNLFELDLLPITVP
jgi:hypothetical protein